MKRRYGKQQLYRKKRWSITTWRIIICLVLIAVGCSISFPTAPSVIGLTVHFLDVGQADATLVSCEGQTMLVDAGLNVDAGNLVNTLKNLGVRKIDLLVGTHPHEDHIGGLDAVIDAFDIGVVWMPDIAYDTWSYRSVCKAIDKKHLKLVAPKVWDTFALGGATVTVFSPKRTDYEDLNHCSLVLKVEYNKFSMLLMGDSEEINEIEMMRAGLPLKADVLKAGHHGGNKSTSKAFFSAVKPTACIISCGPDNPNFHPHPSILRRFEQSKSAIYRTDLQGTINLVSDGKGFNITVEGKKSNVMNWLRRIMQGTEGSDEIND